MAAVMEAEIAAALVDDCIDDFDVSAAADASPESTMMSMDQLLDDNDPTQSSTSSAALGPSIVSGTTDLFEGDLCDDELDEIPSILMPNGTKGGYEEILQLNPVDLVEEVQEEVQQAAVSNPETGLATTRTSTRSGVAPLQVGATPAPVTIISLEAKPPVVHFVVRKLSDAEAVGSKKRPAAAVPLSSSRLTKKARQVGTTSTITPAVKAEDGATPTRMTRSRTKKEKTTPTSSRKVKPEHVPSNKHAATKSSKAGAQQKASSAAPTMLAKLTVSTTAAENANNNRVRSPNESETDSTLAPPVVTPVDTDETVCAKQLVMKSRMASASTTIPLPSVNNKNGPATATNTTTALANAPQQADTKAAIKETPTASKKSASRRANGGSKSNSKPGQNASSCNSNGTAAYAVLVDTSTAHIQALTGENGASVCLSVRSCTAFANGEEEVTEAAAPKPTAVNSNNVSTKSEQAAQVAQAPMTEEERAQQSRDRNRKHARNTRLRKKAYVEELKETLNEMVNQRDRDNSEQQQTRQRELDQREVRFRVLEEFLKVRGRNETDAARWNAILAPSFSLSMPLTPFQEMVDGAVNARGGQTLKGVDQVMQDSSHFASFLQTLGSSADEPEKVVSLVYQCDRKDFMMDGCNVVLEWNARSVGGMDKGASPEITLHGSLRAHFCPESNRLRTTDMVFDTGTIVTQRDAMVG